MQDKVKQTIETYEEFADLYTKLHSDVSELKEELDYFIANLPGEKVLDIGCGPGRDSKYLADSGLIVTGVDLTQKFVDIAQNYAPNAQFFRMDMRNLALTPKSYDGLWVRASFLHIPKSEAKSTMQEFRRVLKQGGLLYIGVKEGEGEQLIAEKKYNNKERFFSYYTENELKELIESCGFKTFKIGSKKLNDPKWINYFGIKL